MTSVTMRLAVFNLQSNMKIGVMETQMKYLLLIVIAVLMLTSVAVAQTPMIFDVSDVVVGAKRIDTRYFLATGKWSDGGKDVGVQSVWINCYQRF
jgi:hypothetical protein